MEKGSGLQDLQKNRAPYELKNKQILHTLQLASDINDNEICVQKVSSSETQDLEFDVKCLRSIFSKIAQHEYFQKIFLILLAVFLLSCLLWDKKENIMLSLVVEKIQLICNCVFLLLLVIKLIAWKQIMTFWVLLDFITSISGIIGYAVQDQQVARYFKAVRTFKLVFLIKQISHFNQPAAKLLTTVTDLRKVLIPAILIIYIYAIIGLYSFSDFEYSRCRHPSNLQKESDWTVYEDQVFLCGERGCPILADGTQLICLNPIYYQIQPNPQELVNIDQGNGLLVYSNIFYAFLSTFKQTFVTGSSRLIILYKQAINQFYVEIYYYSYIYLISYIYLNIFYSLIIVESFNKGELIEQEEQQSYNRDEDVHSTKLRNQLQLESSNHSIQKSKSINKFNKNSCLSSNFSIQNKVKFASIQNQIRNQKKVSIKTQPQKTQKKYKLVLIPPKQTIKVSQKNIEGDLTTKKTKINNIFDCNKIQETSFQLFKNIPIVGLQDHNSLSNSPSTIYQDPTVLLSALPIEFYQKKRRYQIASCIIVAFCCINLSLDYHGQNPKFKFIVDCIDVCFYLLLVIEVLAKIYVERSYTKRVSVFTKMECIIVIVCTAGIVCEAAIAQDFQDFLSASDSISGVIRSTKYLRILIIIASTQFFKETKIIFQCTIQSVSNMKNVIGLWLLIVIIISITGFHLHSYKTKVNENGKLDLENGQGFQLSFDGMYNSVIFTLLTFYNEEWDYLMFQQYLGSDFLIVIWQLISIVIGLLLFSKYFMVLLMQKLEQLIDQNQEDEKQKIKDFIEQKSDKDQQQEQEQPKFRQTFGDESFKNSKRISLKIKRKIQRKTSVQITPGKQENQSLLHKFVLVCEKVINHKIYQVIFILFILISCAALINLTPNVNRKSHEAKIYVILDRVCKVFFIIDLILNLVVYGLCQNENSYFRKSYFKWINLLIIITQIISFSMIGHNAIFQKIQKIKALRVVFFVEMRYNEDWKMRMTFLSFMKLLPKVFTLLTVTLAIFSYFGLLLVKLYKDQHFNCINYQNGSDISIKTKFDCFSWGGDWVQLSINTSNFLDATLYLFLVATTEGWISLMQPMMNFTGKDFEPVLNSNKYISSFFVIFFFFGNLIMLNAFIGLSISNLNKIKQKVNGSQKLSKKQKIWLGVKTQIHRLKPIFFQQKPENVIRGYAFVIVNHAGYKLMQAFCFVSFLITMSFFKTNMTAEERKTITNVQYTFICVFVLEYILQGLAFGYRSDYQKSFVFNTIVILYAIVYVFVNEVDLGIKTANLRIIGGIFITLQSLRYMTLLNQIFIVRKLLNCLISVLPQANNLLLLICMTIFIYAIIGMQLFAFLRPSKELDSFNQNYTNFPSALFALIKFSSMESPIQQISDAAQTLSPNFICEQIYTYSEYLKYGQNGCGSKATSYIFFISFHVLYSLLLMSTLMAVIVNSYYQVAKEQRAIITKFVFLKVQKQWSKLDPEATGYIPYRQFWMFTAKLLEIYLNQNEIKESEEAQNRFTKLVTSKGKFLTDMNIPIYENQQGNLCFQFNEVIQALTKIYLENIIGQITSSKAQKMFLQRQQKQKISFKKSNFKSEHVSILIVLKLGLRQWKKKADGSAIGCTQAIQKYKATSRYLEVQKAQTEKFEQNLSQV